jgi:HSP20 family molecular chaperone IbpA
MIGAMDGSILERWRREIDAARARAAELLDESEVAAELPARWVVTEDAVVWWIETGEVDEPDVDLEDVGRALVVRVRRRGEPAIARVLLPTPSDWVVEAIAVDFRDGGLEVRLVIRSGPSD